MSKREIFMWAMTYLIGTWYVYSYGMVEALKEMRAKRGLITKDDEEVYRKENNIFTWKDHFWSFLEMIFWTSIVVLGDVAIFYKGASLDFNDLSGIIISSIFAFLSLNVFTGAILTEDELNEKGSASKWLIKQFATLKEFIVKRVTNREYDKLKRKNLSLIKKWCREEKIKVASLVEKLNNQTFINIMPKSITNESKEELMGTCKFIGEVFLDNNQDLFTELKKLFNTHLLDLEVDISLITMYLHEHDEYIVEETLDKINTRISNKVKRNKVKKRKSINKVNDSDTLENMVEAITGTE
ncbi:MAG: hypothetical protein ACLVKE_07260 [Clostridium baratii]